MFLSPSSLIYYTTIFYLLTFAGIGYGVAGVVLGAG
ncbi:hypothetical protein THAOC_32997, partial [Thalassiosira oceanica]